MLIARANPLFDDFIERIPGEKLKYLSMWKGYVDPKNEAYNESIASSVGKDFLYMHTSDHCDMDSLNELFQILYPRAIIPIHTDNPEAFAKLFRKEWPIIVLNDGDSMSPFTDSYVDSKYAMVVSGRKRSASDISSLTSKHVSHLPIQCLALLIKLVTRLLKRKIWLIIKAKRVFCLV